MVSLLVKHPFATVITILISVSLYIAYEIRESIMMLVVPPSLEADRFHEQLSASEQVNKALDNLRLETNAHSVIVRQFHNGKYDLTGIPFTKSSITFYSLEERMEDEYEEPLSAMSTSLNKMWIKIDNPQCIVEDHGLDRTTKHYMDIYELNTIVICPMVNLLNYPVGTMTVGYRQSDKMNVAEVKNVAHRITGYLNGTSEN